MIGRVLGAIARRIALNALAAMLKNVAGDPLATAPAPGSKAGQLNVNELVKLVVAYVLPWAVAHAAAFGPAGPYVAGVAGLLIQAWRMLGHGDPTDPSDPAPAVPSPSAEPALDPNHV